MERNLTSSCLKLAPLLLLVFAVFIFTGCQGVALTNKTNQPVYAGHTEYPYNAENDVFIYGPPTWQYKLKVERKSKGVSIKSIEPFVVINNKSHAMKLSDGWKGNVSYWTYYRTPECESPSPPYVSESDYSFVVDYDPGPRNYFVNKPPARLPDSGSFTSRLLNLGIHFEPTRPYPNHASVRGMIFDQNCWETGTGCVPLWKVSELVYPWPNQLQYKFVLRNSEPVDAIITELTLGPLGSDTTSFNMFEIANTDLPITIPACIGAVEIVIIYTPNSTPAYYHHALQLRSMINWSGMPSPANGPWFNVDYEISFNPS